MTKLSHIEDVEQYREEQRSADDAAQADEAVQIADPAGASSHELPAEEDEEFHGLDSTQPMGPLHKVLIALATVVVAIAIVYIVNCWVHFI